MEEMEKALVSYILTKNIGQVITHDKIEELLLIKSGNSKYYTLMKSIDKNLLFYNRGLKVVKGKGYKILGSEALIDKALKMVQQSEKKVSEAVVLVNNIDRDTLSEEYKLKFDVVKVKFVQVHNNLVGGVKELFLITDNKKSKLKEVR